jgi:hypothetical protein
MLVGRLSAAKGEIKINKCYLCGTEINDENTTVEHIILNSIGGRLKSSKLICKKCNSNFGNTIDSNLSKQLEFFANFLDIKRERGLVQDVEMIKESTGEKYRVTSKGIPIPSKPIVEELNKGNCTEIKIKARSKKELEGILTGLKRKYPNINIEDLLKDANSVKEPISEPLHITLTIGGKESMPAILKMTINYFIEKTGDTSSVKDAINDLKRNETNRVEPIILEKRLFSLDENEVTHSIFLNANKKEKKVYAIIELYSTIQFIIKLSDKYNGEDFQELYVYDVLKTEEIVKKIDNVPPFDFIFSFEYPKSKPDFQILKNNMDHVLQVGSRIKLQILISNVIEKSLAETWGKLPHDHLITQEDTDILTNKLMENIGPLIM